MFLLVLFISGCYTAAVSDVTCNGRDAMNFVFTKTAGTTITKFTLTGCSDQNVDLPADAYTVAGDQYTFDFNPYDRCVTTPARDPNDASTYDVGITLLAIRAENIAGRDLIKGGDKVALSCRFQTNYQVESDLRTISLSGEELTGEEFRLSFEMDRTQSDYATPDTSEIETNQLVYHTIKATNSAQLESTDFTFKPYRIRLQKKSDPDSFFDLFNVAMSTCGHDALNFQIAYTNGQYNFQYSQILLDSDLSAEYKLVADLKLCNPDASSAECTAFDKCVVVSNAVSVAGPVYPRDRNLINSDQPTFLWRNWEMNMFINTYESGTRFMVEGYVGSMISVEVSITDYIRVWMRYYNYGAVELEVLWKCGYNEGLYKASYPFTWGQPERKFVSFEGRTDAVTGVRTMLLFVDGVEEQFDTFDTPGTNAECSEAPAQIYAGDIGMDFADVELTQFLYAELQ